MKKLSILLLVLVMIFSLCGCEQETSNSDVVANDEFVIEKEASAAKGYSEDETSAVTSEEETQTEETETTSPVVFRTETGEKYHRGSCIHLKSKIETTVDEARSIGLKPCFVCQPPQ